MPVWFSDLRDPISDLIAYLRAGLPKVPTASPPPVPSGPGAAVQGSVRDVTYGCINGYGPNGLGGVPNPQSPDKAIRRSPARISAPSSTPTPKSST